MCENINAEISSGTIASGVEAVGYLTWTFFARRIKSNPSYYGAESGDQEGVDAFLVSVVKDTIEKLRESGCVDCGDGEAEGVDFQVASTVLGNAATTYYLKYRTPKQMQMGVRQARKILTQAIAEVDTENADSGVTLKSGNATNAVPFERPTRVDELTIAWLLYALVATHEFDELPVRHTEEHLNEALSKDLMWGPDTSSLMSGGNGQQYHNEEIFSDPHTKGFLLIQAHIERAKLPISDYLNDTRSVVDNIPRLLAAMRYIAVSDHTTAGTFELTTQFSRTRQIIETRSRVNDNPLTQLPGFNSETIRRMKSGRKDTVSIREMRAMKRNEASSLLQRVFTGRGKQASQIDKALDALSALPVVTISDITVRNEVDKTSGKNKGKMTIVLDIQRQKRKTGRNAESCTLNLVLGSWQQRMLLSDASIRLTRFGSWKVTKELVFDWAAANADGGIDGGKMILRLLFDEIRGFDSETIVNLK